jgi:hypothetical protein
VNLKRIGWWVAIAFALWWVIEQPHAAAGAVHNLGTLASHAANALGTFASSI